jgi:hypothetical protein
MRYRGQTIMSLYRRTHLPHSTPLRLLTVAISGARKGADRLALRAIGRRPQGSGVGRFEISYEPARRLEGRENGTCAFAEADSWQTWPLRVRAEGNLVAVVEEDSHLPAGQKDLPIELLLEQAPLRSFLGARDCAGGE